MFNTLYNNYPALSYYYNPYLISNLQFDKLLLNSLILLNLNTFLLSIQFHIMLH